MKVLQVQLKDSRVDLTAFHSKAVVMLFTIRGLLLLSLCGWLLSCNCVRVRVCFTMFSVHVSALQCLGLVCGL